MKLYELAHARAGDKGNISNIAVIARSAHAYQMLAEWLTAARVKAYFGTQVSGTVMRYDLPKLAAFNFVLQGSLQGGVTRSTALDAHGKSLSSALLNMTVNSEDSGTSTTRHAGGCLCGAIRYEATGTSSKVASCHCSLCRRHGGAAFLTYAAFAREQVRFSRGAPALYRSSAEAVRGHCAACGSPLTFVFDDAPATIWVTVGSMDDANAFTPIENWHVADKLPWVVLDESLPSWAHAPE